MIDVEQSNNYEFVYSVQNLKAGLAEISTALNSNSCKPSICILKPRLLLEKTIVPFVHGIRFRFAINPI